MFFSIQRFSGGSGEGETPVPIPNTAVKPLSADGTARASVWESRSLPGSYSHRGPREIEGRSVCPGVRCGGGVTGSGRAARAGGGVWTRLGPRNRRAARAV
jgi:hypothetical protein